MHYFNKIKYQKLYPPLYISQYKKATHPPLVTWNSEEHSIVDMIGSLF